MRKNLIVAFLVIVIAALASTSWCEWRRANNEHNLWIHADAVRADTYMDWAKQARQILDLKKQLSDWRSQRNGQIVPFCLTAEITPKPGCTARAWANGVEVDCGKEAKIYVCNPLNGPSPR
jgi:hypothetical protein